MTLADRIDALLPQTQCTRCGYPACRPYAEALASRSTSANLCEPGGTRLIPALAALAGLPALPPAQVELPVQVAWIREQDCIGCARCLPACPVDAILGARRFSHTVIAQDCTGCALCIAPCPVDCIEMRAPSADWVAPAVADNRARHAAHLARYAARAVARSRARSESAMPAAAAGPEAGRATAAGPEATPAAGPDMAERRAALIARARAAAAARRSQA